MTLTTAVKTALEAHPYKQELFVKIAFPGYTLALSTMMRDFDTLGDSVYYVGAGALGSISGISDNADMSANPVELKLSGLDSNIMSELQDFEHQGSAVTIKCGLFDSSSDLIADPFTLFSGIVDTMSMVAGETLDIIVRCDSVLRLIFRGPDGGRRMQSQQIAIFASDVGLEFAMGLKEDIPWGVATKLATASKSSSLSGALDRARARATP